MIEVIEALAEASRRGERAVLVTVIDGAGSTPRKAGAKMLVRAVDPVVGTIGGGRLEHLVTRDARRILAEEPPGAGLRMVEYRLSADLAMCCGGMMRLLLEPMDPPEVLCLFGGGHVALALARAARPLGMRVWVFDENEEYCNRERFDETIADRLFHTFDPHEFATEIPDGSAYGVITTREHRIDQDLLQALCTKPWAYLGLIGSRTKVTRFRQRLLARGVPPEALDRVHMPVGLDIGAETPEEIAVSIVAEIVSVRRGRAGEQRHRPLSEIAAATGRRDPDRNTGS